VRFALFCRHGFDVEANEAGDLGGVPS
jgi:hypothetical protein